IEGPLVERRVVLERAHQTGGYGRLRRAVRPMQQDQTVRAPLLREVAEHPVDLVLDLLLADQGIALCVARFPREIEKLESGVLPPCALDERGPVMVENIAQVPRCVAAVANRIAREQLEVLVK